MAPLSSPLDLRPHLYTLARVGVALGVLILLLVWVFRRRWLTNVALATSDLIPDSSLSSSNPTYPYIACSRDDLYPHILQASASSRANRTHSPTSSQSNRSSLCSSDLAFVLSLPRPNLHIHAYDVTKIRSSTNNTPDISTEQEVEESTNNQTDKSAVSSHGHIITYLLGNDTALRHTDVLARHPVYRRRVRTWEIGARPEQALAKPELYEGEGECEQLEKQRLFERTETCSDGPELREEGAAS